MTEQRYLADDTVRRFEATVERTLEDRVVLDGTHFYPTGGGQPHDTGTLYVADDPDRRFRVVDVEKSDTIYHTLDPVSGDDSAAGPDAPATPDAPAAPDASTLPEPGTAVIGEIDWDRRRAHARYHTAQHLLSALLLEAFGAQTTGNQLYADRAHLDAAYDRFDADDLDRIERRLNELVADDRPVTSYTMDRADAEATLDTDRTRIDLLPDSITELRIVEIGGADAATGDVADAASDDADPYDRTACAGTHVGSTGEIGEVVVTGRETKGSGEERIRFALADHVA
ncbi:alanyl-tRNA editing protein [Halorubrum halodurans]|uniref:Alanyl-tRNA editing protein n=1 Tax=Halorubrum halodurans TaxID=1383851 RepID=A0A256IIV7_9EURY|nr:alanyl-tRNA editing protein [Halorubrum halodurans]OYR56236.1 alanyl-tRNA editing protein [Halorubrum halodurans]